MAFSAAPVRLRLGLSPSLLTLLIMEWSVLQAPVAAVTVAVAVVALGQEPLRPRVRLRPTPPAVVSMLTLLSFPSMLSGFWYKLNSYHSIMKLAVVFLCLGITCLVDANAGGPKPGKLTGAEARRIAKTLYLLCAAADKAKTGPESERKAKQLCLIEEVFSYLTTISVRLGCTLGDILSLVGVSPDAARLIQAGDSEGVLKTVDVGTLVKSTVVLVEGLCANVGILLKPVLLDVHKALGSGSSLPSSLSILCETIGEVLTSLKGTPLADLLASISGALSGVLSGLTGGGKGGIAGGSGHLTGGGEGNSAGGGLTGGQGGIAGHLTSSLY